MPHSLLRRLSARLRPAAPALRTTRRAALGLVAAGVLAGCQVGGIGGGGGGAGVASEGPTRVALLVPYGSARGSDATLARSLENAARLALADIEGARIELTVLPTQGTPAGAQSAAQQAVAGGAQVILGPLYADNAAAAGVAAAGSGVPVLSFSNNTSVAGGNVWVLGSTFQNTARRLLSFAAAQGRNRVLVTHPNTPSGQIAQNAIVSVAGGTGAQITGSVPYGFSQEGVVAAVPTVKAQVESTATNAVFLTADSAGALPILAQLLPEAGIGGDAVKFLGLARWDVPAQTLQLPGLQGGWFALPDPAPLAAFRSRYAASYGGEPHPLAGLAYDGMAAIGAIARRGETVGRRSLTRGTGFAGTNGIFRLRPDGTNDRGLAVAQVTSGTSRIVSPAPSSFGGFGS
ncbi:penicillin-binding protein activator [Jannaschia sp. Os4]|uniref:penicillin-binding protein activator n=1 Tax=Jannaschia sp. Os4 TaxID=2807617 RepID=UPI00193AD298|nr:penicillin-binding protein activator [Jannaschia sp. Os4]MBM2575361.1 penicillin-binding protein activator [Jannaschia sp. Os4]